MADPLIAAGLGILEAATEFLPVSSTGHLLLASHFLGFESAGGVFEVAIQLGAIMAIVVLYFATLWNVVTDLPKQGHHGNNARRFTIAIVVAFLPAAVLGVLLHGVIKEVLFNPIIVCTMLVVGGLVILYLENTRRRPAHIHEVHQVTWRTALTIGACQCLALVPGVSRSGASIMGSLALGLDRKTAAEFSFFLSIPTMFGAVAYDLFKNREVLTFTDLHLIAIGLTTAFITALLVVKWLVGFVSRRGFIPFAYYRIAVGSLGLVLLALGL